MKTVFVDSIELDIVLDKPYVLMKMQNIYNEYISLKSMNELKFYTYICRFNKKNNEEKYLKKLKQKLFFPNQID